MLNHSEDVTRSAVGGCLGALCKYLSPEQLDDAMLNYILNDDADDWTSKHGKSAALFVALKEAPSVVFLPKYETKLFKTITNNIVSEKIPIASNSIRAIGYLFEHCMAQALPLPQPIIVPFVRAMNHTSNEVKQLLAKTCNYLAKVIPSEKVPPELLKAIIPMLVNGTKEKNGYVKSNSEIALIAILRLRSGEETYRKSLQILEAGARDSLSEVVTKVLQKVAAQPIGKEEELDDTLLS